MKSKRVKKSQMVKNKGKMGALGANITGIVQRKQSWSKAVTVDWFASVTGILLNI
jgi:hypothetical protein